MEVSLFYVVSHSSSRSYIVYIIITQNAISCRMRPLLCLVPYHQRAVNESKGIPVKYMICGMEVYLA